MAEPIFAAKVQCTVGNLGKKTVVAIAIAATQETLGNLSVTLGKGPIIRPAKEGPIAEQDGAEPTSKLAGRLGV